MATMAQKTGAEFIGTFWLVFGGCGSAVLAAAFPNLGIGFVGVALAFGLTVLTMAYAIGHISGCHLNPAVSVGLWAGGRFPAKELVPYIIAQVVGGIAAGGSSTSSPAARPASLLRRLCLQRLRRPFARRYSAVAALVSEIVMTFMFLFIIMGATDKRRPRASPRSPSASPYADPPDQHPRHQHLGEPGPQHRRRGLCRRLGAGQLWLFWVAPIAGGVLGGFVYRWLAGDKS